MRPRRLRLFAHRLLFFAVAAGVATAAASVTTRKAAVDPDRTSLIASYKNWGRDCTPAGDPDIRILSQPQNGRLDLKSGNYLVEGAAPPPGVSDCRGRYLPGVGIHYTPHPGFHGEDRFRYTVAIGASKPVTTEVETMVTVR